MTDGIEARSFACLSIQRALLGEVSSRLRAAVFTRANRQLEIRLYFDGPIDEDDLESGSCIESEVLADYSAEDVVLVNCIQFDAPLPVRDNGVWVFKRRE